MPAQKKNETTQKTREGLLKKLSRLPSLNDPKRPSNDSVRKYLSVPVILALMLMFVAIGVLGYSFYFLHHFQVYNYVTSYFPWKWHVTFHSLSSVQREFEDGIGASLFMLTISVVIILLSVHSIRNRPAGATTSIEIIPDVVKNRQVLEEARRKRRQKEKENQTVLSYLHSRLHSKSRIGATVLSILAILMFLASYRFYNPVIEFDSVIAFIGSLILVFLDTSHSVQARVVDSVLESSRALVDELSSSLVDAKFLFVLMGKTVNSVFVIPVEGATSGLQAQQGRNSPSELLAEQREIQLIPFGRGLADLYIKELGIPKPSIDSIVSGAQRILCQNLHLASEARIERSANRIEVILKHPIFKTSCNPKHNSNLPSKQGCLGCEVCSMHAVIVSFSLSKSVSIEKCDYDPESDATLVSLKIEKE
ncbi:MAG: hypothetical protein JRN52_00655 [Nitrososphaerota archaeon]|nr:hypothetical protein [Nitrososphaerota archaeon]